MSRLNLLLSVLMLILLGACASGPEPIPQPLVTSAPTLQAADPLEEHNLISVRLDEIRLLPIAGDRTLPISSVWMIPINTDRPITAKMQYIEGENYVTLSPNQTYKPSSPWIISIDRKDLNQENFGIWFVVFNPIDNSEITRERINQLVLDTGAVLAGGTMATFLTVATPGLPDEAVMAGAVVSGIAARAKAYGANFVKDMASRAPAMAGALTTSQMTSLFETTEAIDHLQYFGEIYVIIPASDNYYLN